MTYRIVINIKQEIYLFKIIKAVENIARKKDLSDIREFVFYI
jgi:hypothetical protein